MEEQMKNLLMRILAVFVIESTGTIAGASLLHMNTYLAAGLAGLLAVWMVFRDLAKAFLDDGKLTQDEINAAFKKASDKE
jgi:hypothetical protein